MSPKSFEFDLPEHLPTSPMCPANKKHKSGGTGVCVYHGRSKREGEPHVAQSVGTFRAPTSRVGGDKHDHQRFDVFIKKIDVIKERNTE